MSGCPPTLKSPGEAEGQVPATLSQSWGGSLVHADDTQPAPCTLSLTLPCPPQHMREAAERRQQLELEHEQALAVLKAKQQEIDLLQKVSGLGVRAGRLWGRGLEGAGCSEWVQTGLSLA